MEKKAGAQFLLTESVQPHPETTDSKVASCLFLNCAGFEGFQIATVQLINDLSSLPPLAILSSSHLL
jgi:hypothetical protein